MIACNSKHPPGIIGIISGDLARYPEFAQHLERLLVPMGTTWKWVEGGSVESNRNLVLNEMPDAAQWVWFIDDDHEYERELLFKLLDRQVDIIQALCSTRKPPFRPYAYRRDPAAEPYGYISADWDEIPLTGISEWDAAGTGGMLIRRNVLDAVGYPWFEVGRTAKDAPGEDLYFCTKAKALGFRVFVDSDNWTGHMGKMTVWPGRHNDQWLVDLDLRHGVKVGVPREAWATTKYEEIDPKHLRPSLVQR